MRILATGGAGYIGSHACKTLAAAGHEVIVYGNLSTGFRKLAKWGECIREDILDEEKLQACLRKHKPEGIIHFAAFSQVGESVSNPDRYIRNNVGGTLNTLESMRDMDVRNIVVSSTAAVYGTLPYNRRHARASHQLLWGNKAVHGMDTGGFRAGIRDFMDSTMLFQYGGSRPGRRVRRMP